MLGRRTSSAALNKKGEESSSPILPLLQRSNSGSNTANCSPVSARNSVSSFGHTFSSAASSGASLSSNSGSDSDNESIDASDRADSKCRNSPSNSAVFKRDKLPNGFCTGKKSLMQLQLKLGGMRFSFLLLILCFALFACLEIHRLLVLRRINKSWVFSPIMNIERPCPAPKYPTLGNDPAGKDLKICLTTLTDAKTQKEASPLRKIVRWRNYDDILDLTWESRQKYADKQGYYLFDSSDLVDVSRPAQWSKILAAQHLLEVEKCDWVLWHDADTLFMNTDFRIQDILPSDPNMDVLVAIDTPNPGYNSGSWLVKNSPYGRQFLQDWWDMKSYVRLPGQALSGDNDAFKALLASLSKSDFDTHIGIAPRCTINAFAKFLRPRQSQKMTEEELHAQPWYLSENFYHKGDFMVHVAGYDNKAGTLQMLMEEIQ